MPENPWPKIKEYFGISSHNEVIASTEIALSDRIASPFYGYFALSWIVFNWKLIYIAFFIDQSRLFEKTNLLRIEYLVSLTPTYPGFSFFWQFLIGPALLAFLALWVFPYGTRIFFRKNLRNKVALKVIELQELRKEKTEERELKKAETKLIETEIEHAKVEKKAAQEQPEILWEREYYQFKILPLFKKFSFIVESVYEHSGNITTHHPYNDDVVTFQIPKDILAYAHTNNLVVFDETKRKIDLTEKGKLFVRKYSAETSV